MNQDRREFLGRLGGASVLGLVPMTIGASSFDVLRGHTAVASSDEWDLSWVNKLTGKYRAVFDVPEIDSGYGVWRASLWAKQYMDVLHAAPTELSSVVVLRHKGIALAMTQSFWDSYGVAKANTVIHPITQQGTDRNPALLSSKRGEIPADFDDVALDRYLARGGIALACNLAFDDMIQLVTKKDGSTGAAARKTALAGIIPGVVLQPSGVFAALHAQDAGCKYLRAS